MKTFILTLIGIVPLIAAFSGHKAFIVFPGFTTLGAFDLHNRLLYPSDGDSIQGLSQETGLEENKFGKPESGDWLGMGKSQDNIDTPSIGVQPVIEWETPLSDFEDLALDPDSYWNGSDGSGGFTTAEVHLYNEYNPDWFSWSGWAYSNVSDNTTPGLINQYSAITGTGNRDESRVGNNYGVGYVSGPPVLDFADDLAHEVAGLYVTNSTYSALSMEHGDAFSKKFGGEEGSDPDYFKLIVWGYANGSPTDSVEYLLADYRFENDTMDYIIKTWQWLELSSLGKVDSLMFALESSDMGDWGMNTPGFFCIDDIYVVPNQDPVWTGAAKEDSIFDFVVFPNPGTGKYMIASTSPDVLGVKVFNLIGSVLFENPHYSPGEMIDISVHPAGVYLIRVTNTQGAFSKIIQNL